MDSYRQELSETIHRENTIDYMTSLFDGLRVVDGIGDLLAKLRLERASDLHQLRPLLHAL